jgi:hypothetical protein
MYMIGCACTRIGDVFGHQLFVVVLSRAVLRARLAPVLIDTLWIAKGGFARPAFTGFHKLKTRTFRTRRLHARCFNIRHEQATSGFGAPFGMESLHLEENVEPTGQ